MADNIRILELACAAVGIVFCIHGLHEYTLLSLNDSGHNNMYWSASGTFLLMFNGAATCAILFQSQFVMQYVGYLMMWTGRALHFILMGLYVFPTMCTKHKQNLDMGCWKHADLYDKMVLVASASSVIFGVILLVLRCTIIETNHSYSMNVGSQQQLDVINIAAAVASAGMLVWGCIAFLGALQHYKTFNAPFCHEFARAIFIVIAGAASCVSSLMVSPSVGMCFGFLYHCLGRGIFYLLTGFYMYVALRDKPEDLCRLCSVVAMIVGLIYIVLFFFSRGQPTPTWASSSRNGCAHQQGVQLTTRTVTVQPAR